MKTEKRDLILQSIIEAYLAERAPIGSNDLMIRMSEVIPASTIRVYFKQLSSEGAIVQRHTSGGRMPTAATMAAYWQSMLDFGTIAIGDVALLRALADEFEIYCMIFAKFDEILQDVINYSNRYILLDLGSGEIILRFDEKIYRLLISLRGTHLGDLERICAQVGLSSLRAKIDAIKREKILFITGEMNAVNAFGDDRFKRILTPDFANDFGERNLLFEPYFDSGFMGVKRDAIFGDTPATMICAGSVYRNFGKFFEMLEDVA